MAPSDPTSILAIAVTAIVPLVSLISLSIYLTSHPASPFFSLLRRGGVQLPTTSTDGLGPEIDPFELEDPIVCIDGVPVKPERFWRRQRFIKVALVLTLLLPTIANIALLVLTVLRSKDLDASVRERVILLPTLLIPAHLTTLLIAYWAINQNETRTHWPSTIHLASGTLVQFLVLGFMAIWPTAPFPRADTAVMSLIPRHDVFKLLTGLLPILQLPPLLCATTLRRGPPMYLPFDSLYPAKVTEAIPVGHEVLDPDVPNVSAEVQVTVVEWLLFSFAGEVIDRAKVRDSMEVWDLPILPANMRALYNYLKIKNVYGRRRTRLGKKEGYNLLFKLAKVNKGLLIAQISLAAIAGVGYYLPHYVLKWYLEYLENDPQRNDIAWGWVLVLGLCLSNAWIYIVSGIIWSISSTLLTGRFRLQLNTILFAKTLRKKDIAAAGDDTGAVGGVQEEAVKAKQRKETGDEKEDDEAVQSKSQIMTLFTVDVDRVTEFIFHSFTIVDAPVEIIMATVFLLNLLGYSAIFGLLATLLCLPLNHMASRFVVTAQENLMKTRDQRTALMNEVLQGIRMLKFMAWERPFESRIAKIRRNELSWQARNYQIEVAFNCIWALTPVVVTVVSFMHYTLVRGERLTPSKAFTSIAVFNELRFALSALPETFIQVLQGFVSCRRIEKYMTLDEVNDSGEFEGGDIILNNATYTWPKDDSDGAPKSTAPTPRAQFSLADLTLRFPEGKLSLICGRLGSGKSLLLSGLLGEADLVAGQVKCPRSRPDMMSNFGANVADEEWLLPGMVAYVPQAAWLQNASIKENILFSSPWNAARYDAVIEACSLATDLEILEDGDETEIGEKGLNLSGGQKARVSLARAIYSRASTIFLDDVLSAVDAHTAHAIMENCLRGRLTAGRTVLLVSHHTALVSPAAAYIVALENGDVKFAGTRAEFVEGGLMKELDADDPEAKPTAEEKAEEKTIEELKSKPQHKSVVSLSGVETPDVASETSSIAATDDEETAVASATSTTEPVKVRTPRKLIEDERRVRGRIARDVWFTYFKALGGPIWWFCLGICLIIATAVPVVERGWLSYWSGEDERDYGKHSSTYYVVGYTIIAISGCFLQNLQFASTYYGALHASKILHNRMLERVLLATLRFHDTTNRGRLLNRFGKDIEGLDSAMGDHFVRTIQYALNVLTTTAISLYVGGWRFGIAFLLVLVVYYRAGSVYGQASRDMRRLDSVTRSPLYSLFGETVSGVAVIRAFGASTVALSQMMRLADTNIVSFAWTWTVNRWLSARFNFLSSLLVGITAGAMLVRGADSATAGFTLSFTVSIMNDVLFVVRRFVQLEQSMVALERIKEYSEVAIEAPEFVDPRPPASWPAEGAIEVENLVVRYAPELPDVLHSLTFSVKPCEKIGIVGSTGCGKSTLALSFFRFVEATSGKIVIDNIDISQIGLTDLRSRIMIIPQDPTILSGTLRSTLDVFDEYSDADIYEALRRVHLLKEDDVVAGESEGSAAAEVSRTSEEDRNANVFRDLSYPVSEGGENFSAGEKQLICMARAILRRNKVLLMDEATASIDYETDELISQTIRKEFRDSTIITIAHRIHTIIDFDKVLLLDKGRICEYASPAELLRDHKSRFYALCRATGRSEFKNLKEMALAAEKRRSG